MGLPVIAIVLTGIGMIYRRYKSKPVKKEQVTRDHYTLYVDEMGRLENFK